MRRYIFNAVCIIALCLLVVGIVSAEWVYVMDQDNWTANFISRLSGVLTLCAQSFIPSADNVSAIKLQPASLNYLTVEIRPDNGGEPSNIILGSTTTFDPSSQRYIFDTPVSVTPGLTYYIVFWFNDPGSNFVYGEPYEHTYANGQSYYKLLGGNWVVGQPYLGPGNYDYVFQTFYLYWTEDPIAEAGPNQRAGANQTVTLDGSASYDPDGTIVNYEWRRLPNYFGNYDIIYNGPNPTCEAKALGRVEEVIQLTVTDNFGATSEPDIMQIFWRRPGQNNDSEVKAQERPADSQEQSSESQMQEVTK